MSTKNDWYQLTEAPLFEHTVENCNPTDVKDRAEVILGPETPKVTQWKQEFFRRRVLAAEIYSRCVDHCNNY